MSYQPLFYPQLNNYNASVNPAGVHTSGDATTAYYQRMLYQRAMSVFQWDTPITWDNSYLMYTLAACGYAIILDSDKYAAEDSAKYGVVPQWGTLSGYGIYYQPTRAYVTNPLINARDLAIGRDCELIRLTPDYSGLMDIIQTYAELLSMCSTATSMNLMNSRVSFAIAAKNKSAAATIKAIYSKVSSGEPAVVYDGSFLQDYNGTNPQPWECFTQDVGKNYIADKTLAAYDTILNQFDEEIGIPSLRGAAGEKKERLLTDEVHRNDIATTARVSTWLECLERSIDKVNNMFGLGISVKLRSAKPDQPTEEAAADDR
jgi:hypothetical protein